MTVHLTTNCPVSTPSLSGKVPPGGVGIRARFLIVELNSIAVVTRFMSRYTFPRNT